MASASLKPTEKPLTSGDTVKGTTEETPIPVSLLNSQNKRMCNEADLWQTSTPATDRSFVRKRNQMVVSSPSIDFASFSFLLSSPYSFTHKAFTKAMRRSIALRRMVR